MGIKDLIITPVFLILLYILAYRVRPLVTNSLTRRYFIPALTLKFIGAISLGLIYQFYYGGGDTFSFHTQGSTWIWRAFLDSPIKGIELLFSNGTYSQNTFEYAQHIWYFGDEASYFIVRVAGFFDLLTFNTYSSTALLFAIFSFAGLWAMYSTFQRLYPSLINKIAYAIFFIPSVILWGSGILKDSITLGALGWLTYAVFNIFYFKTKILVNFILLVLAFFILFTVKIYILLCILPAVIIFIFGSKLKSIKSTIIKFIAAPLVLTLSITIAYFSILKIGENNPKYALDQLAVTSQITAYDIAYWTGRNAGSTYDIGELDGTFIGMLKLLPQAINVSLFRPYFWEVSNPFMLLSAVESFLIMLFTLYVFFKTSFVQMAKKITNPIVFFCLAFALSFAFAVGVSTFNFGSLARYKIPMIPFYLLALILLHRRDYTNKA
jgi:hypothetical protein